MATTVIPGTLTTETLVVTQSITVPASSFDNTDMAAGSAGNYLAATKAIHQFAIPYKQVTGTAIVAAAAEDVHIVRGATGLVVGLEAAITGVIATGADRTVTVDLHKSTAGGAFASVLSTTITLNNSSVLRTAVAAVVNTASDDLVDGDILRIVVSVAGSAGNQAQGLIVTLFIREDPQ